MCLDVICLFALSVAFGDRTRELGRRGENDLFPCACLYKAVMDRFCDRTGAGIFSFDNVLACSLFKGPHYWLRRRRPERLWNRIHTVTMVGDDNEVVLLLGLFGYGQTENLVHVLPGQCEFDTAIGANCSDAAIFSVNEIESELLTLW